jgi:hypothetical protein
VNAFRQFSRQMRKKKRKKKRKEKAVIPSFSTQIPGKFTDFGLHQVVRLRLEIMLFFMLCLDKDIESFLEFSH